MSGSYAEQPLLACPQCGVTFASEIWLIIDATERLDLLASIVAGSIHQVVCPYGHKSEVDAPLLLFRPGEDVPLVFVPARRTTAEQDGLVAATLVKRLRDTSASVWRDEWTAEAPPILSRQILSLWLKSEAAEALQQRYQKIGDMAALDESIAHWEGILHDPDFKVADGMVQATITNNAGLAFRNRFLTGSGPEDLERALVLWRRGEALVPRDSPLAVAFSNNIANALTDRFVQNGDLNALEEAITYFRYVLGTLSRAAPDYTHTLSNLGRTLYYRFGQLGEVNDLNESVVVLEEALANTAEQDALRTMSTLSGALSRRYHITGQADDLNRAIELAEKVAQQANVPLSDFPDYQLNYGNRLLDRYARDGRKDDLDRAVTTFCGAADAVPAGAPVRVGISSQLGDALLSRFQLAGDIGDLDKAIAILADVLKRTATDSIDYPGRLSRLGEAYLMRYLRLNEIEDLIKADLYCSYCIEKTPIGAPSRAGRLGTLASVRKARYDKFSNSADLDDAIAKLEEALSILPADSPNRSVTLHRAANCYLARFETTGRLSDLNQAIQTYETTVANDPPLSPNRSISLYSFARSLFSRFLFDGRSEDAHAARRLAQEAWEAARHTNPQTAMLAARLWARISVLYGEWEVALEATDQAHELARQVMLLNPLVANRLAWLREVQGMAALTAYARAKRGDFESAVVELENGLAQALNGKLGLRRDRQLLKRLREECPAHFARFEAVNEAWYDSQIADDLPKIEHSGPHETGSSDWMQDERSRQAADAWANLIAVIDEINTLPGYELLFTPPSWSDIVDAVEPGNPLVYVVTTPAGSVAFIVYRAEIGAGIAPVWAALTEFDLEQLLIRRAVENGNVGPVIGGLLPAQVGKIAEMKAELAAMLPLVGERLMAPLAARLRAMGITRVTLVSGGQLALLPIHAAAYDVDGEWRTFLDEFQVAHAPSAQAAVRTRERAEMFDWTGGPALVVGNPVPMPKPYAPLVYAGVEAKMVASFTVGEVTALLEAKATAMTVWEEMLGKRLLHFACHARFTPRFPPKSGIVLADGKVLTLEHIRTLSLFGTRLVVLSACQTALNDFRELPDESIGLPGGFLEVGAAGIVGTLWPVSDASTGILMSDFYRRVMAGLEPAEALCLAQRWLRDAPRQEISDYLMSYVSAGFEWASALHAALPSGGPNEPVYRHPYYWAAFTLTGA